MFKRIAKEISFWVLALIITLFAAIYQRKTGPTYPIQGEIDLGGSNVSYTLLRSHGGEGDQPVRITAPDSIISAVLVYRRYKTNDQWTRVPMQREGGELVAALPHQPPAGKLEYHVEIARGDLVKSIPEEENAVTRFKGAVPEFILIPHILAIFLSMLFAARTALQALRRRAPLLGYMSAAIVLLIIGGFIFGPIVQKYAFGAYWTGFPFGMDLTDNKTLIALIAWLAAFFIYKRKKQARWAVLAAFIVMFGIFMIPHSMHGSELDYSKLDAEQIVESEL